MPSDASTAHNRLDSIHDNEEKKKLTLTQKMKLVFPELASMTKIPMSVKSHYLGTRQQVKSGEKELTWTGLTLLELNAMTERLRERGRAQYAKIRQAGGKPFGEQETKTVNVNSQKKKRRVETDQTTTTEDVEPPVRKRSKIREAPRPTHVHQARPTQSKKSSKTLQRFEPVLEQDYEAGEVVSSSTSDEDDSSSCSD